MVRIPDDRDEPAWGFAGDAGRPVSFGAKLTKGKEVFDMPRGDGTGPAGGGAGRGRKNVSRGGQGVSGSSDGYRDTCPGRGNSLRGRRNRSLNTGLSEPQRSPGPGFGPGPGGASTYGPDSTAGPDLQVLKAQARELEKVLDGIRDLIQQLEPETERNQQA